MQPKYATTVVARLLLAYDTLMRYLQEQSNTEDLLNPTQLLILVGIHQHGQPRGLTVNEVHSRGYMGSNIAYNINALEAAGYIERSTKPGDRRATLISLTLKGTGVVERALSLLMAMENEVGTFFSAESLMATMQFTQVIGRTLPPSRASTHASAKHAAAGQ